ncbi:MAG: hypothetical protein QW046_04600 [Candidatus Micrarchaeaceae archaeon]
MKPNEIAEMSDKEITDLLQDYVSEHENKFAGSYLFSIIKIVRSWLAHNGKDIKRKIKIKGAEQSPTLKNERIPTQDELIKILNNATVQSRVTCSLMAFSGLRPEVIGNYEGKDGLKLGDIPDLILGREISFSKIPAMIKVRAELSKSKKPYFTLIGQQGCEYLKEYLEYRIRTGEKLNQDSPVITAKISKKPFISTMNIGDQVRKAIRASGLNQRPYVLRAYFDTQLMMAENKGLIMRDYRTFMMGHVGNIEHRYTLNKNNLPEDVIEDMRESYSKSLRFLETERRGIKEEEMNEKINDFKRMMLILAGYSNDEIDREKMLELNNEDLAKKIDEKKAKSLNNSHSQ